MKKNKRNNNYDKIISARFTLFLIVTLFLFSVVIIKIVDVMIMNKKTYTDNLAVLTYSTVSGTSSPRGRIYDRNYHILVDNKSLKTITYRKQKGISNLDMIKVASELIPHISLDYQKLTERAKREYYFAKNKSLCDKLVTKAEKEKVKQMKMTQNELDELKISRIKKEDLNFSEEEQKIAYLYYLMNKGYTYEEVWKNEGGYLESLNGNRFRDDTDVNQYLFREWEKQKGNFIPVNLHKDFAYFEIGDDNRKLISCIKGKKKKMICINDTSKDADFEKAVSEINEALDKNLPGKSRYEMDE